MLRLHVKLKTVLMEKGIQQKQLAEMTGIREASISEFANNVRGTLNIQYILKIMETLEIDDIREIVEVKRID